MKTLEINQAVCESRENTKVVEFLNETQLKPEIAQAIESGNIWGVYFKEGEIVAEDIWGEVHKDVVL